MGILVGVMLRWLAAHADVLVFAGGLAAFIVGVFVLCGVGVGLVVAGVALMLAGWFLL